MLNPTPYANLDPSLILNAIESLGFICSGSLFALNSYENRVYKVGIDEGPALIVKFYRPERWTDAAILEEHGFSLELISHEIPVVAPLIVDKNTLHHYQDYRFALFSCLAGKALELDNMEQLQWMGRFLGRLHAVSACQTFQHRLNLNTQNYGYQPFQYLIEHDFIPQEIKQKYSEVVTEILQQIDQCFVKIGSYQTIRIHGDCHAGNVLWNNHGPHIVDLDDCMMGPAIQDIWMLLSGQNAYETDAQLDAILQGYRQFHDFNYQEVQLINALRALRMIHYSAWLARRWSDPAFPLNFPWFNTIRYWQEQLYGLQEQLNLMQASGDDDYQSY